MVKAFEYLKTVQYKLPTAFCEVLTLLKLTYIFLCWTINTVSQSCEKKVLQKTEDKKEDDNNNNIHK